MKAGLLLEFVRGEGSCCFSVQTHWLASGEEEVGRLANESKSSGLVGDPSLLLGLRQPIVLRALSLLSQGWRSPVDLP